MRLPFITAWSLWLSRHPVWISAAILILVTMARWAAGGYDVGRFILLERGRVVQDELIHDVNIYDQGYDGQYFYRYALAPFSADKPYGKKVGDMGVKVDIPTYRRGRVVYPLAAWVLALGQAAAVPWTLILVNILAMVWLVHLTSRIADRFGQPVWTAYLPLLIGGLWMSLARDLADLPACALLAWAWWSLLNHRRGVFLLASTLLLLCREASAFHLFPAFVVLALQDFRHRRWLPATSLVVPWSLWGGWTLFLRNLYPVGQPALYDRLSAHFDWPFQGMALGLSEHVFAAKVLVLLWTLGVVASGLWVFLTHRKHLQWTWMTAALPVNLILWMTYGVPIYVDMWSFLRVLAPVVLMTFYFIIEQGVRIPRWLIGLSAITAASVVWLTIWQA